MSSDKTEVVSIPFPKVPELEVSTILGKGGSGTVYKGRQPFLKRDVAIKVLNVTNGSIDEDFVNRFHREAQILADLIHPNIVSCFQAGMTEESADFPVSPYLAMEFVDGPSLQAWINRTGVVEESIALDITEKIASALDYAHKKNIIHRDIKAENILLKPEHAHASAETGFNYTPKLADLGIARSTSPDSESNLTMVGTMIGTPSSMAPEQFNEPDKVDFKADIYGLGCVLFHMVTGKKPYEGSNLTQMVIGKNSNESLDPSSVNPKLNKKVVKFICSLMATRKEDRPESYTELIQQCQSIASGLSRRTGQPAPANSGQKSNTAIYMLLTVAIIFAVSAYFFLPMFNQPPVETTASADTNNITDPKPAPIPEAAGPADELLKVIVEEAEPVSEQPEATPEVAKIASEMSKAIPEVVNTVSELSKATAEIVSQVSEQASPESEIVESASIIPESKFEEAMSIAKIVEDKAANTEMLKTAKETNNKNVLTIQFEDKSSTFLARGEEFHVRVETQQDANIYCYFEDQNNEVVRFFPNQFRTDPYILKSQALILPGNFPFTFLASEDGVNERMACFALSNEIKKHLPERIIGVDFETLSVNSLGQVIKIYSQLSETDISYAILNIRVL